MTMVMEGVRVLDVSQWAFVPSAAAVLASWGADVIKVEHPVHGDPMRWLKSAGTVEIGGVSVMHELVGHSKRSVGIDLGTDEGHTLLLRLVETADVFFTNFLPEARAKLGIDVQDVRARNPRIIYGRGSAHGPLGPEADKGGFDMVSFWYRGAISSAITPSGHPYPLRMPSPGFGDLPGGLMLAGATAAALAYRERTGNAMVVDVSLLGAAIWSLQAGIVSAGVLGGDESGWPPSPSEPGNPLANTYRTADGRFVAINMLQSDRYWPGLCQAIGWPDLVDDPRFIDANARAAHTRDCVAVLSDIFGSQDLDHWVNALAGQDGPWDVVRTPLEVHQDPQALANGYLQPVERGDGTRLTMVAPPVQFDELPTPIRPSHQLGADTEEVLLEAGLDWAEIGRLKELGAII